MLTQTVIQVSIGLLALTRRRSRNRKPAMNWDRETTVPEWIFPNETFRIRIFISETCGPRATLPRGHALGLGFPPSAEGLAIP
jgi:hypothetical protein